MGSRFEQPTSSPGITSETEQRVGFQINTEAFPPPKADEWLLLRSEDGPNQLQIKIYHTITIFPPYNSTR